MLSVADTASLWGLEGQHVKVETDVARGLPAWHIVGLGDKTIIEAAERIKAAIVNSGYDYPRQRITVNLSPAGKPKEGTHFDLPVAVGLLSAAGEIKGGIGGYAYIGELSLDGSLNRVRGALPLVAVCAGAGIKNVFVPGGNAGEAAMVKGITVYPASRLEEIVDHLNGKNRIAAYINERKTAEPVLEDDLDFSEVRGQDCAKRAMVICAAGAHGLLMMGSPGCGKTMLAKRLPGILPPMTYREQLEVTQIYSIAGMLTEETPVIARRPFRSPHQNTTLAAMLGGGARPAPGEFSLAHMGVLFMDEFSQFDRSIINALRQPLEEEKVIIARRGGTAVFPGKVIFVAASNPCMCGWAGDPVRRCTCTAGQMASFNARLSGPILDRIDMRIDVPRVEMAEAGPGMGSAEMKAMVMKAREVQEARYREEQFFFNSQLTAGGIEKYCPLNRGAAELMRNAYASLSLSMRTYHRTIKLARTIADIEGSEKIREEHAAEALQYRRERNENN